MNSLGERVHALGLLNRVSNDQTDLDDMWEEEQEVVELLDETVAIFIFDIEVEWFLVEGDVSDVQVGGIPDTGAVPNSSEIVHLVDELNHVVDVEDGVWVFEGLCFDAAGYELSDMLESPAQVEM